MDDSGGRQERERLQQAAALARFWLSQFADASTFVWRGDRTPQEYACEALDGIRELLTGTDGEQVAVGSQKIERLRPGRAGFVAFHQNLARQALSMGHQGAARAALRALRSSDFVGASVDDHLATLRDSRASAEVVADALSAILSLDPLPERDDIE